MRCLKNKYNICIYKVFLLRISPCPGGLPRSSHRRCSSKRVFLKTYTYNFIKETPIQVFSCEICEIFKNNFFYRTPQVAASRIPRFTSTPSRSLLVQRSNRNSKTICQICSKLKSVQIYSDAHWF